MAVSVATHRQSNQITMFVGSVRVAAVPIWLLRLFGRQSPSRIQALQSIMGRFPPQRVADLWRKSQTQK